MELELFDPYSPDAAQIWNRVEPRSFFTSWGWIENWLACLPSDRTTHLAVLRDGDRIGTCLLGEVRVVRRGVIPVRSMHLNATGTQRFDDVIIEYNGVNGAEPRLADLLAAMPHGCDELELPGVRETSFGGLSTDGTGWDVEIEKRSPAYFVDLEAARSGYLAKLSSQTRSQIRRAQKAAGTLSVEVATDAAKAIEIYDELCVLHIAQWRVRGHPGAFADPWLDRFHRRLIATRFAAGEIQLIRVRTGSATLGCLYNFVWGDRVMQYQTGFRGSDDAREKPGYVCHTAAIEHCAREGLGVYDFLAGDHRYKRSLSTGNDTLVWCKVRRPRWRFRLEEQLVKLVRAVRSRSS
ncbi:MAG: GNAT family N-acetyltransferase [Deltaproteobacteria bacterium]|nr:GNAT family N-acetyltransferase [Deltaproteobacteria bacterium]